MGADASPLAPLEGDGRSHETVVIGAGVVGMAIALRLQGEGARVLVLDRTGVAAEASRGNAGAFAFSDILPLASPGILRKVPGWLMDPLGPLALRPGYLPTIAPWLFRFWQASRPARVRASIEAQAALLRLSAEETPRMLQSAAALGMLRSDGMLHLYESEEEWRAALPGWALRAEHGIDFRHLHGAAAIASLQPGLNPAFVAATFVPEWKTISDPYVLVQTLARAVEEGGGRIRRAEVRGLESGPTGVRLHLPDGGSVHAARVVVAAGAWSHRLARGLGDRIPLETERGYNTTLAPDAFDLRRQLSFGNHGFVVTPLARGVRVGGAVELAGLDAPPDFRRADALLAKARRFMPGLRTEGGTQWMGFRPSLPDSLPVIGPAAADGRVLYAFGHGHLGLTESAATARLVADLHFGRPPAIDLTPFSPGRFGAPPQRRLP